MRLKVRSEVARALSGGRPVVALESSVVAQGLPAPHGQRAAERCEAAVRDEGAVPATIAVLDGEVRVGLGPGEVARLADPGTPVSKLGSSALAIATATGLTGGTTVSATCEIAAAAGVRLFATGGIGGVHRGAEESFDISQDLWALSRFPVGVVCTGAKAILDLPKTVEVLESVAVPVMGFGTGELPAFYAGSAGLPLEHRFDDAALLACVLRERFERWRQGGALIVQPAPLVPVAPSALRRQIDRAVSAARRAGVRGRAVTPFLLQRLAREEGQLLEANMALLESNARLAARIARAYFRSPRRTRARAGA